LRLISPAAFASAYATLSIPRPDVPQLRHVDDRRYGDIMPVVRRRARSRSRGADRQIYFDPVGPFGCAEVARDRIASSGGNMDIKALAKQLTRVKRIGSTTAQIQAETVRSGGHAKPNPRTSRA
jgi:hypothetical protein